MRKIVHNRSFLTTYYYTILKNAKSFTNFTTCIKHTNGYAHKCNFFEGEKINVIGGLKLHNK